MDCLKSFNFSAAGQTNFSGVDVKTWLVGTEQYWSFADTSGGSRFNIEGFKNVNVYGVDVVGNISTLPNSPTGGCIPLDWSISVSIDGLAPIIGGNVRVTPNFYSITTNQANIQAFDLGRYKTKIDLASPIESAKSITLSNLRANGIGAQTLGNVNIQWILDFVIYYKFEGE
jgi:hypothetical protein